MGKIDQAGSSAAEPQGNAKVDAEVNSVTGEADTELVGGANFHAENWKLIHPDVASHGGTLTPPALGLSRRLLLLRCFFQVALPTLFFPSCSSQPRPCSSKNFPTLITTMDLRTFLHSGKPKYSRIDHVSLLGACGAPFRKERP